jgi:hypothetical protein
MPARSPISRREAGVLVTLAAGACLWWLLPYIPQPQSYHDFADRRAVLGVPNFADVVSNLAFVAVGLLGLWRIQAGARALPPAVRSSLNVFFAGLLLTGFGSAYYHWAPVDQTLVADRLPITMAFAGMFGALLAERISARCGLAVLLLMLVVGPASVFYWKHTGDLSLYGLVQFGGIAGVLLVLTLTPKGQDPFPWWTLLAWYAVAKVVESEDVAIWHATRELAGGHVFKHLAAAMGGLAIANALRRPARR